MLIYQDFFKRKKKSWRIKHGQEPSQIPKPVSSTPLILLALVLPAALAGMCRLLQ
jgi:hypothetical protein